MEPHLAPKDKKMFYGYLDGAKYYFEYGSGGSTYQATIRPNVEKVYSVESDLAWHNKLKQLLQNNSDKIEYIYSDLDTKPNTWGRPGSNCTHEQFIKYSDHIRLLDSETAKKINLVMIDGRFRVACCLKCFDVINDNCFIAFDDFLNRSRYHVVLDYYDIVDKTKNKRMVILKKKPGVKSVPSNLIKKYELISA